MCAHKGDGESGADSGKLAGTVEEREGIGMGKGELS